MARIGLWWCRWRHNNTYWPMHGTYECKVCWRRHPAFVAVGK